MLHLEGIAVHMFTAELAGVPANAIGGEVMILEARRDEVLAAVDSLLTGV